MQIETWKYLSFINERPDRLMHKLIVHLRYHRLHQRSQLADWIRENSDVSRGDAGIIITNHGTDQYIFGIGYVLSSVIASQPPALIPLWFVSQRVNRASDAHVALKHAAGGVVHMILSNAGRVISEPGLLVLNHPLTTVDKKAMGLPLDLAVGKAITIVAYQGREHDMKHSFRRTSAQHYSFTPEYQEISARVNGQRLPTSDSTFDVAGHLHEIMGDDFPTTKLTAFIPLPQHPMEKAAMELLMLEELVEQAHAEAASQPALLMLQHIESETGQAIEEVLHDARANMDRMIAEAHAAHAEVTARAELRTAQLQSSKVGLSAASPAVSSPAAASSSSASSSSSSQQVTRRYDDPASVPPEWIRVCKDLESLRSAARLKYRHSKAIALSVLHSPLLRLASVSKTGGSHRVYHFADGQAPLTLVSHHGSGDSLVSRRSATRLYEQLMQVAMAAMQQTNNN